MTAARRPSTRSAERPECALPPRAGEGAAIAAARLAPSLVHAGEGAPCDNELRPDGQVGGALTSTALDAPSLEPKAPAAGSEAAGASLSEEQQPRILREWPPEERFDRPDMVVREKPRGVCRVTGTPEWERWI